MARDFNNFFHLKKRLYIMGFPPSTHQQIFHLSYTSLVDTFDTHSDSEINQQPKRSSNDFCKSDPLPTWFVKEWQDVLIVL